MFIRVLYFCNHFLHIDTKLIVKLQERRKLSAATAVCTLNATARRRKTSTQRHEGARTREKVQCKDRILSITTVWMGFRKAGEGQTAQHKAFLAFAPLAPWRLTRPLTLAGGTAERCWSRKLNQQNKALIVFAVLGALCVFAFKAPVDDARHEHQGRNGREFSASRPAPARRSPGPFGIRCERAGRRLGTRCGPPRRPAAARPAPARAIPPGTGRRLPAGRGCR